MIVEDICIGSSDALQSVQSVEFVAGMGIVGDRHFRDYPATSNKPGRVTLIEAEVLEDINLSNLQARRQIVTRGIRLNDLVGKVFQVGSVILKGYKLCEPCLHLEQVTKRSGLIEELLHKGGIRADVLSGGSVLTGDKILPVSEDHQIEWVRRFVLQYKAGCSCGNIRTGSKLTEEDALEDFVDHIRDIIRKEHER